MPLSPSMQEAPEPCTVRAMAMRGTHRDIEKTRERDERRRAMVHARLDLAFKAVTIFFAAISAAIEVLTALRLA